MNSLAALPSPTTAVWQVGPLPLRAYALCIIVGMVVACVVTDRRMRARGTTPWVVLDIAIWAIPFGIVGSRVYSLITSPQDYFGAGHGFWEWAQIWHGGLGIWGGVAGGTLGAWIACRQRGLALTFVADALAPGLPLAQAIGRWGNWFNNELYGRPTSLPWGLKVHQMDGGHAVLGPDGKPLPVDGLHPDQLYQPTFLYEFLWCVGVAVLVWALDRRYRFGRGRAFALYVMAYTAGRFWIESLRIDEANHFLGVRLNDWVSVAVFLAALAYFLLRRGAVPQRAVLVPDGGGDGKPANRYAMVDAPEGAVQETARARATGEDAAAAPDGAGTGEPGPEPDATTQTGAEAGSGAETGPEPGAEATTGAGAGDAGADQGSADVPAGAGAGEPDAAPHPVRK
ncbi:MAG TPA: prolipoprotein diacylglyceryl transferase [Rugosimonospora sp.]|nr:prolipoprotein diacylglyceryl transferase [Rugosimonospora sp.]